MLKGHEKLRNIHESTFMKLFCHCKGNWPGKPLLLVIFEVFWLFVIILTADDKYSLFNIWNLAELNEIQLSKNLTTYCLFFSPLLKSASNCKHFEKKMTLITYVFLKLQTVKDMVREMFKPPRFRALFDSQHLKAPQTLMKSAWQHFYYIFW